MLFRLVNAAHSQGLEGRASEGSRNRLGSLLSYSEMSTTVIKL